MAVESFVQEHVGAARRGRESAALAEKAKRLALET